MQLLLFGFAVEPRPLAAITFRAFRTERRFLWALTDRLTRAMGCSYSHSDVVGQVLAPAGL